MNKLTNNFSRLASASRLVLSAFFLICISGPAFGQEDYASWPYSKSWVINTSPTGANITGNVYNFPVLLRLNAHNFDFSLAAVTGADIRFANARGTHLPYQIERWNSASALAEVWVRLDTILANNSTQFITIYWGKANAGDSSNGATVFDTGAGFKAVYHFNGNLEDATPGNYDLNGGTSADYPAIVGVGRDFTIGASTSVNFSAPPQGTVMFWLNYDAAFTTVASILGTTDGFEAVIGAPGATISNQFFKEGADVLASPKNDWATGTWYHITLSWNAATDSSYIFINGLLNASGANSTDSAVVDTILSVGARTGQPQNLDGKLDEVRITSVMRSPDWVRLTYENQKPGQTLVEEQPEVYSTWAYSKKWVLNTTVTGANVPEDVYGFPVLIRLNISNFIFNQSPSGGRDIRFSKEDGSHLPYQIDQWNYIPNIADIWVSVDTVFGNNSTQSIIMYWGKSNVQDKSNGNAVFNTANGFAAVWHLEEHNVPEPATFKDATANGVHGTGISMGNLTHITGISGLGHDFDGLEDYITTPVSQEGLFDFTEAMTVSAWFKVSAFTKAYQTIISKGDTQWRLSRYIADNSLTFSTNQSTSQGLTSTMVVNDSNWHYVTATTNSQAINFYMDGQLDTSIAMHTSLANTNLPLWIGNNADQTARHWGGSLDEVRMAGRERSASWIKLCYENQKAAQTLVKEDTPEENYSLWPQKKRWILNTTHTGAYTTQGISKFPLLLRLDQSNFDFFLARSDGGDTRFMDMYGNKLPYEIEYWSKSEQKALVWVLADTILPNNGQQYITHYWGRSGVTTRSSPAQVFSPVNHYKGTWHLQQPPAGPFYPLTNSAGNFSHGRPMGGLNTSNHTESYIGKGLSMNGTGGYVYIDSLSVVTQAGSRTISLWARADNFAYNGIFQAGVNLSPGKDFSLRTGGGDNIIRMQLWESEQDVPTPDARQNWHHYALTYDASTARLYYDGLLVGEKSVNLSTSSQNGFTIGKWDNMFFNGALDEVRVSFAARSQTWLKLCYENQKHNQTLIQEEPEDYSQWLYSISWVLNTTTTGTLINTPLYNFPVLIKLSSDNFNFRQADLLGEDIRFSKPNGTPVFFEIESWESVGAASQASIWVLADTILPDNKATINMYWGNSSAKIKSNSSAVFNTENGFNGIYHLSSDPAAGAAGAVTDATGYLNHGTSTSDMSNVNLKNGIASGAYEFNGTSNRILLANKSNFNISGTFTLSAWVQTGSGSGTGAFTIASKALSSQNDGWQIGLTDLSYPAIINRSSGSATVLQSNTSISMNTSWHHVAFTAANGVWSIYIDGRPDTSASAGIDLTQNDAPAYLGGTANDVLFKGYLDEVRVESQSRSPSWLSLCFENQKPDQAFVEQQDNLSSWLYSKKLYLNTASKGAAVSDTLYNFPALIRLDASFFDFSQAQSGGKDIRFSTSSGRHMAYEIEVWDRAAGIAAIWVKLDTVLGSTDTQYINMHWGSPNAPDRSGREPVFEAANNYQAVWHMNQDPSVSAIYDATTYPYDQTPYGAMTHEDLATGQIGSSLIFDGTDDRLQLGAGYPILMNAESFTFSAWVKTSVKKTQVIAAISINNAGQPTDISRAQLMINSNGNPVLYGKTRDTDILQQLASDFVLDTVFVYITGIADYNNRTLTLYINGSLDTIRTNVTFGNTNTSTTTPENVTIGSEENGLNSWFQGAIDEVRIIDTIRSPGWIKLCYENQKADQKFLLPYSSRNGIPQVGFVLPGIIPASQIKQDTAGRGILTVNFKILDSDKDLISLSNFGYSLDSGTTWLTPVSNDTSPALPSSWASAYYTSDTTFAAATVHSFTINTQHSDIPGFILVDRHNVLFRFHARDLVETSSWIFTEPVNVYNALPAVSVNSKATSSLSPSLAGQIDDTTASIEVRVGGQNILALNQKNGLWLLESGRLSPLDYGAYEVQVTARDAFGNTGTGTTFNELVVGSMIDSSITRLAILQTYTNTMYIDEIWQFLALAYNSDSMEVDLEFIQWSALGPVSIDSGKVTPLGLGLFRIIALAGALRDTTGWIQIKGRLTIPDSASITQAMGSNIQLTLPPAPGGNAHSIYLNAIAASMLPAGLVKSGPAIIFDTTGAYAFDSLIKISLKVDTAIISNWASGAIRYHVYENCTDPAGKWALTDAALDSVWFTLYTDTLCSYIIALDSIIPQLTTDSLPREALTGSAISIPFAVADNISNPRVYLRVRQGGWSRDSIIPVPLSSDSGGTAQIPGFLLTRAGLAYSLEVWDGSNTVTLAATDLSITITGEVTMPEGYIIQNAYQMFSIPHTVTSSTISQLLYDDLGSYNRDTWRLYRFDGDFKEFINNDTLPLKPGQAYWLNTSKTQVRIDADSSRAHTLPVSSPFRADIKEGWNCIASPFAFNVSWDSVRVYNDTSLKAIYTYDGQNKVWGDPNILTELEPWKGYLLWIKGAKNTYINIPPVSIDTNTTLAKTATPGSEVRFEIWAKTDSLMDLAAAGFGFKGSSVSRDSRDYLKPQIFKKSLQVYFNPEWGLAPSDRYLTDYRGALSGGQYWEFNVQNSLKTVNTVLEFQQTGILTKGTQWALLDLNEKKVIRNPQNAYEYSHQESDFRNFELVIGEETYINQRIQNANWRPLAFKLGQNFPNPVRTHTVFRYQLPAASGNKPAKYKVELAILDLLGRTRVKIFEDIQSAGFYTKYWDGKGARTQSLSAGTYIYQLKAGAYFSHKMLVILP